MWLLYTDSQMILRALKLNMLFDHLQIMLENITISFNTNSLSLRQLLECCLQLKKSEIYQILRHSETSLKLLYWSFCYNST